MDCYPAIISLNACDDCIRVAQESEANLNKKIMEVSCEKGRLWSEAVTTSDTLRQKEKELSQTKCRVLELEVTLTELEENLAKSKREISELKSTNQASQEQSVAPSSTPSSLETSRLDELRKAALMSVKGVRLKPNEAQEVSPVNV